MPFQLPSINLKGDISATIHDATGTAPNTIIEAGKHWSVHIDWSLTGVGANLLGGSWHVHVNLESIGPGPELSLFDNADVKCRKQPLNATGKYHCHFDVPSNVITPAMVPHQSLPMKLVVTITYLDPYNQPGPIAAYYEGPIVQFVDY